MTLTFEVWWKRFGHPTIAKKTGSPLLADDLRDIAHGAWQTAQLEAGWPRTLKQEVARLHQRVECFSSSDEVQEVFLGILGVIDIMLDKS
jgi:hypothetical protein